MLGVGAGKTSLFVPEKKAFCQIERNGAAVDRQKGARTGGPHLVAQPGKHFLSDARLTEKQDREARRGDDLDLLDDVVNQGTVSEKKPVLAPVEHLGRVVPFDDQIRNPLDHAVEEMRRGMFQKRGPALTEETFDVASFQRWGFGQHGIVPGRRWSQELERGFVHGEKFPDIRISGSVIEQKTAKPAKVFPLDPVEMKSEPFFVDAGHESPCLDRIRTFRLLCRRPLFRFPAVDPETDPSVDSSSSKRTDETAGQRQVGQYTLAEPSGGGPKADRYFKVQPFMVTQGTLRIRSVSKIPRTTSSSFASLASLKNGGLFVSFIIISNKLFRPTPTKGGSSKLQASGDFPNIRPLAHALPVPVFFERAPPDGISGLSVQDLLFDSL